METMQSLSSMVLERITDEELHRLHERKDDTLINHMVPTIIYYAKRHTRISQSYQLSIDDVIQDSCLSAILAIDNWAGGGTLRGFVGLQIRRGFHRLLYLHRWHGASSKLSEQKDAARAVMLLKSYGESVTNERAAKELGWSVDRVVSATILPAYSDIIDNLACAKEQEVQQCMKDVEDLAEMLSDKDKQIVLMLYGLGGCSAISQRQVAKNLRVTTKRVRGTTELLKIAASGGMLCPLCGKSFVPVAKRRFCSISCTSKAGSNKAKLKLGGKSIDVVVDRE